MDVAGYANEKIFYDWAVLWEEGSRPQVNGKDAHMTIPRLLYLDNYFSHLNWETLEYLRMHNVRVVTMHPHTTHLFCVLDTAIFATFKRFLYQYFDDFSIHISMDNIGKYIRLAYGKATTVTYNPVTRTTTSAASNGFASTGLFPFSRIVLKKDVFKSSEAYLASAAAAKAKAGIAIAPAVSVRLSAADRATAVSDFAEQQLQVQLTTTSAAYNPEKKQRPKQKSELVSGAVYIAQQKKVADDKVAEEERLVGVRKKRAVNAAAKLLKAEEVAAQKLLKVAVPVVAPPKPAAAPVAAAAVPVAVGKKRKAAAPPDVPDFGPPKSKSRKFIEHST